MQKIILIVGLVIIVVAGAFFSWNYIKSKQVISAINNFNECAAAGFPVAESFPRQCRTPDGRAFIEDIGNILEKQNLIRVTNPQPNQLIQNPLILKGETRGYWFFEASFPVKLLDGNGKEIGRGIAQALSEWMTENFVPFEATIQFQTPTTSKGKLILEKDNPSGLPENEDQLWVPIRFK